MNDIIRTKLDSLPDKPGSYQMLDSEKRIIYVGKAKNLRNRVKSYFVGSHDAKTTNLVANIADFTYIVTASELEAFLLELSLIKEHSPRFNILLTDDKTYPYIEITREKNPRLSITRNPSNKNKMLFGPYPDASSARETLRLLDKIFPFRKCVNMPKKVCLYYHMGQCLGPCEHPVEMDTYWEMVKKVRSLLTGRDQTVVDELRKKMDEMSENREYEKAGEYRDLIQAVERTLAKQTVIFADATDRDIVNYDHFDHYMAVAVLFMRQGKIIFSEIRIVTFYDEPQEAFVNYLAQFYNRHLVPEGEVLLPEGPDYSLLGDIIHKRGFVPKRGSKRDLVKMARENASLYLKNNLPSYLKKSDQTIGALEELGKTLDMPAPIRIEAFDNSNTMGSDPVSSMVVFTNGLPDKKEYRKYKVKSVIGADDYATMREIIYRRYQRMLMEDGKEPDLIIMDGGKGQMSSAREILDSLGLDTILVAGLKKDDKHKTDVLIAPSGAETKLDRHTPLYVFLNRIQEEAHRFAISYHREKQAKKIYDSYLDKIPGIGPLTKEKLLQKYRTIANITGATDEELESLGLRKDQIRNLRIATSDLANR